MLPSHMAIMMLDEHIYRKAFYKRYAHRFRPFDSIIGCVFATLEAEEEAQTQELMPLIYEALENDTLTLTTESDCGERHPEEIDNEADQQNFFVINNAMAKVLLQTAIQMEYESSDFYEALSKTAKNHPLLSLFFRCLSLYVEDHRQVLEEVLDYFTTQPPTNDPMSAKILVTLN